MKHRATFITCEFSMITQAIVNNLMPILFVIFKDDFGISYTSIAGLTLLNFVVQILTDMSAPWLLKTIGYRKTGLLSQASAILGLLCMGVLIHFLPKYPTLLISTVFCAFGGGLLEVMVSPIVEVLGKGESSQRMSLLHSFYCWGQVAVVGVSTSLIYFIGNKVWWVLPLLWSVIPIISMTMFSKVYIPTVDDEKTTLSPKALFRLKTFLVMCILMLCAGASEITMAMWASVFAQKGLGLSKISGDILGPCLFAILMGSGRLLQGLYGSRFNLRKTLLCASILCFFCYIGASVSQNQYIAVLACALTGFSVSVMWPGVYSYSAYHIPHGKTMMFGILALFGDMGCSFGSYLCGTISDYSLTFQKVLDYAQKIGITPEQIGLKIGILSTAIFPLAMSFVLFFYKRKKQKNAA